MSRRNQGRRRRAYAKRQHEVRQRRTGQPEQEEMLDAGQLDEIHSELIERRLGGRAAA